MLNFISIALWISVNAIFSWIPFTPLLCVLAAFFLVLPPLFEFHLKDLLIIRKYKKIFIINLIINYVVFPLVSVWMAYIFFGMSEFVYALLLLSLISWGWLVMWWITKSKADIKLWFSLFVINLIIFTVLFFPLDAFLTTTWKAFMIDPSLFSCEESALTWNVSCSTTPDWWVSPFSWLMVLVILPLVASRLLLKSKKATDFFISKKSLLLKIWSFLVISYIFSLKQLHSVFSMEPWFLISILMLVLLVYLSMFAINYSVLILLWDNKQSRSLFWIWITRFLTLWMIFSFLYAQYFWTPFLIIFAVAYLVQISLSTIFNHFIFNK